MRAFFLRRAMKFAPVRWAATLMLVAMVLLGVTGALIAMSRLTAEQTAAFYMGDQDASVITMVPVAPGAKAPDLKQTVVKAGAARASQMLVMSGLPLDQSPSVSYFESDWTVSGYAAQFTLLDGRWPQRPGEVATFGIDGDAVSSWSGAWTFTVVGHVRPISSRSATLLAANGTLESLRLPGTSEEFPSVQASPWVAWTGGATGAIVDALASATGTDPDLIRRSQLSLRSETATNRSPNWFYEVVPDLVLPLVVGFAAAAFVFSWVRRRADGMRRQGLAPQKLYEAFFAVLGVCVGVSGLGYPIGWMICFAAAPVWASRISHDISFQFPGLVPIVVAMTSLLLAVGAAAAVVSLRSRKTQVRMGLVVDRALRAAFVGIGLLSVTIAAFADKTLQRGAILMLALLVAAAAAPYGLRWVTGARPASLTGRLGLRLIDRDKAAASIVVAALAAAVGLPLALATYGISAANEMTRWGTIQPAPTGVAILQSPVGDTVPPAVVERFESATGLSSPILMRTVDLELPESYGTAAALLPDLAAVSRWLERPLSDDERALLERGGALTLADGAANARVTLSDGTSQQAELYHVTFREKNYGVTTVFAGAYSRVRGTHELLYYTGLSQDAERDMVSLLAAAQIDRAWVAFHNIPSIFGLSTMASAALALTGLVGSLIVTVAATSQAKTLRGYSAAFLAMGLPRRWIRRVYVYSFSPIALLGIGCGLVAAIVCTSAMTVVAGIELVVPWPALGAWGIGLVMGCSVSFLAGLRRVMPRERI